MFVLLKVQMVLTVCGSRRRKVLSFNHWVCNHYFGWRAVVVGEQPDLIVTKIFPTPGRLSLPDTEIRALLEHGRESG